MVCEYKEHPGVGNTQDHVAHGIRNEAMGAARRLAFGRARERKHVTHYLVHGAANLDPLDSHLPVL